MKILFENKQDQTRFANWLKEIQDYATEADVALNNPALFLELTDDDKWVVNEEERKRVIEQSLRALSDRVYDVSESMFGCV